MAEPFRDLNGNGRQDPYEDPRRPVGERVEDLLGQMTLEEKAGLMFHPPISMSPDGTLLEEAGVFGHGGTTELVAGRHLNHFNVINAPEPRLQAEWQNRIQELAESTRLGIPVTLSSDPCHSVGAGLGASWFASGFSRWPEPIGLAAAGDEELVREFADIARQEYRAVGIHVALHPMADLATEPRWARIMHTFGEDAGLAARLVAAYIRGFQGERLGPHSVACMTKHFPGGGPQRDGEDPHFPYGKDQVYPGGMFDHHLGPFEAAFAAGTAQIMPYYGRPVGIGLEEVGFGYNRGVITGLLRERYGFEGIVCTDWGLVTDYHFPDGSTFGAKCWGVEDLSTEERVLKILEAGCDQLGGESLPDVVVELVRAGRIAEARIDESVRRLLRDKFRLGLFDDPYVDPGEAERICGRAEFRAAGERAQRRSTVLLTNDGRLPLPGRPRLYLEDVRPSSPLHTATWSPPPRTRTSRSCDGTRPSSRGRTASSRASSTPATSTSSSPSSAGCSTSPAASRPSSSSTWSAPPCCRSWWRPARRCSRRSGPTTRPSSTSSSAARPPAGGSRSSSRPRWRPCAPRSRTSRSTRSARFSPSGTGSPTPAVDCQVT